MKNCDRGLENAARGRRPRAAFSRPRSQFFTIRTDPKPGKIENFRPLPEPIRLQDLENSAHSQAKKKIMNHLNYLISDLQNGIVTI